MLKLITAKEHTYSDDPKFSMFQNQTTSLQEEYKATNPVLELNCRLSNETNKSESVNMRA